MENPTKKFIWKGIAFLALLLILVFIINALYWQITIKKTEEYRQEEQYRQFLSGGENALDYGIFGDSHVMLGLNPEYLPNSFNFATVGENYISTYYKMKRVLEKDNVSVPIIILPLDMQTFSGFFVEKDYLFPQTWLYAKFVPLKDISTIRNQPSYSTWLDANFPFGGNGQLLMGDLLIKKTYHGMYRGWANYSDNFSRMDREAFAERKYNQFYGGQELIDNLSLDYFAKTLRLAQTRNISLVFVRFPHSREYDRIAKENNHDTSGYYKFLFDEINATLDDGYVYLDYYGVFFNDSDFLKDPDHVNYRGAEILTKRLYKDLQERNITGKRGKLK